MKWAEVKRQSKQTCPKCKKDYGNGVRKEVRTTISKKQQCGKTMGKGQGRGDRGSVKVATGEKRKKKSSEGEETIEVLRESKWVNCDMDPVVPQLEQ